MNWIRQNKLTAVLLFLVAVLLVRQFVIGNLEIAPNYRNFAQGEIAMDMAAPESTSKSFGGIGMMPPAAREVAPVERDVRMVVEESSMSLVVKEVRESANRVVDLAKEAGGFMVNQNLTRPEEAPFATVVVRVPAERLDEVLESYRNLAVKVSSENIKGTDVTDQYVDIEERLATLEKTKAKYEAILDSAVSVQDTLEVQRELINLQAQIDSLKGRQEYLEKTAELALVTVYLSTDELALPYSPAEPFRPTLVFKYAVRSLVTTLRGLLTAVIWLGVYSAIIVPVVVVIWYLRKKLRKPPTS